jgi:predicted Fe-Mo cluster-binding NifX family protein
MKLCIPTKGNEGMKAEVNLHFGSAPYFTIVDTQTNEIEIINNSDEHHAHGMCQPVKSLTGKNIDAVISGGMGMRAIQRLNQDNIKVFRAEGGNVAEIIGRYKNNSLEELNSQNACAHHGHGCM